MNMNGPAVLSSALMARKGSAAPTGYTPVRAQDVNTGGKAAAFTPEPSANGNGRPRPSAPPQPPSGNRGSRAAGTPIATRQATTEHPRTRVSVRLDRERHLKLKLTAAHLGSSLQEIITDALDRYVDQVAPEVLRNDCACLGIGRPAAAADHRENSFRGLDSDAAR